MQTIVRCAALFVATCASVYGTGAAAAAGQGCDQACLKSQLDGYLAALVAHDPSRLKTAPGVKFTENTNRLQLGDGLWHTMGALGTFKLYVTDPTSGQAAFYGTAQENGLTVLLGVRLKVREQRLSEIETLVVRQATGIHGSFDALTQVDPVWEQTVPEGHRLSREQLTHAANQYFEGIVQGNGDIVPFADDCIRIENGGKTAPIPASGTQPAMTVRESFNTKRFNYIHEITDRRYLVVDPEHGLVVAFAMFQHPGNIPTPMRPSAPGQPRRFSLASYPNTTQIMEAFQLVDGKIHHIFAYIALQPYRQRTGW